MPSPDLHPTKIPALVEALEAKVATETLPPGPPVPPPPPPGMECA